MNISLTQVSGGKLFTVFYNTSRSPVNINFLQFEWYNNTPSIID